MDDNRINGIVEEIGLTELQSKVAEKKTRNCRLAQICAATIEGGFELDYSFADPENNLETLRLNIGEDDEVLSISGVFAPAFLYENEMKELFGINISNISLDYQNKLYRIQVETPFKKKGDPEPKGGEQ